MRVRPAQNGAALVEVVVVVPTLLLLVMVIWQAALAYHAKNALNYAVHEAARAGSVHSAKLGSIQLAFQKAMLPYYGGGRTLSELADTAAKAATDLDGAVRIEILSPTQESFTDFHSPKLAEQLRLGSDAKVIPNVGLDELQCPRDRPDCAKDPKTNASGQTLLDANLLKLRVTYGIPEHKQMPLAGGLFTWVLNVTGGGAGDTFKQGLLTAGRIPVVAHTTLRMQSDAILNSAMVSNPGPGNEGKPVDPDPPPDPDDPKPPTVDPLPTCPYWDPSCNSCRRNPLAPGCTKPPDMCPGKP